MSEWLKEVFSGGVSLARANPVGIGLMALAVILIALAGTISKRFSEESSEPASRFIKVIGLLICALGAIVSII